MGSKDNPSGKALRNAVYALSNYPNAELKQKQHLMDTIKAVGVAAYEQYKDRLLQINSADRKYEMYLRDLALVGNVLKGEALERMIGLFDQLSAEHQVVLVSGPLDGVTNYYLVPDRLLLHALKSRHLSVQEKAAEIISHYPFEGGMQDLTVLRPAAVEVMFRLLFKHPDTFDFTDSFERLGEEFAQNILRKLQESQNPNVQSRLVDGLIVMRGPRSDAALETALYLSNLQMQAKMDIIRALAQRAKHSVLEAFSATTDDVQLLELIQGSLALQALVPRSLGATVQGHEIPSTPATVYDPNLTRYQLQIHQFAPLPSAGAARSLIAIAANNDAPLPARIQSLEALTGHAALRYLKSDIDELHSKLTSFKSPASLIAICEKLQSQLLLVQAAEQRRLNHDTQMSAIKRLVAKPNTMTGHDVSLLILHAKNDSRGPDVQLAALQALSMYPHLKNVVKDIAELHQYFSSASEPDSQLIELCATVLSKLQPTAPEPKPSALPPQNPVSNLIVEATPIPAQTPPTVRDTIGTLASNPTKAAALDLILIVKNDAMDMADRKEALSTLSTHAAVAHVGRKMLELYFELSYSAKYPALADQTGAILTQLRSNKTPLPTPGRPNPDSSAMAVVPQKQKQ